jgi:hypothetical protein
MNFENVEDIYAANRAVRARLLDVIAGIDVDEESTPTENGEWTVGKIIEHLAIVERSMTGISMRLLSKAKENGLAADGDVSLSTSFVEGLLKLRDKETKLEAPDIVQPKGGQSMADSVAALNSNRENLESKKAMFEEFHGKTGTFPHPVFGPMTAIDWLALVGFHEKRHTQQIERILSRKNAANG